MVVVNVLTRRPIAVGAMIRHVDIIEVRAGGIASRWSRKGDLVDESGHESVLQQLRKT